MLKLELSHQRQAVSVHMRTKEPLWTKDFLRALLITGVLHLIAFTLFDVKDTPLDEYPVIKPIEVIADIGGVSQADAGTYDLARGEEGVMSRYFLELKTSMPALPGLPQATNPTPEKLTKPVYPASYAFEALEKTLPQPEEPIEFRYTHHPRIKIKITGALAALQWNGEEFQHLIRELQKLPASPARYAQFGVTVDGKSGEIIASEPLGQNEPLSYQLLSKLQFSTSSAPTIDGVIEFRFNLDPEIASEELFDQEPIQ